MLNRTNILSSPDERAAAQRLERVRDGMQVLDASGEYVGTVAFVKMGDWEAEEGPNETDRHAPAVIAAPAFNMGDTSGRPMAAMPVGPVDDEFDDDVPEAVRARLLQKGYVKIAGGFLFGKDRYVFSDQIGSVGDDEVKLRVNKDELAI